MTKHELFPKVEAPSLGAWADVERLALYEPVIQQAVTRVRLGDMTQEQALVMSTYALYEQKRALFQENVERLAAPSREPGEPQGEWIVVIGKGVWAKCYGHFKDHDEVMAWVRANQFDVEDANALPVTPPGEPGER